jgi:hypothetical protein
MGGGAREIRLGDSLIVNQVQYRIFAREVKFPDFRSYSHRRRKSLDGTSVLLREKERAGVSITPANSVPT